MATRLHSWASIRSHTDLDGYLRWGPGLKIDTTISSRPILHFHHQILKDLHPLSILKGTSRTIQDFSGQRPLWSPNLNNAAGFDHATPRVGLLISLPLGQSHGRRAEKGELGLWLKCVHHGIGGNPWRLVGLVWLEINHFNGLMARHGGWCWWSCFNTQV